MKAGELKIGIVGLGSIGIKHVQELISIGVNNFYALRTNKGAKKLPKELNKYVKEVYTWDDFLSIDIDGYLITNPTSLHIETINRLSDKKKPLFVEKPLSHDLSSISTIPNKQSCIFQIGYCLRYASLFQWIKKNIEEGIIGKIYHSRFYVGQYLPSWHPYTDYKNEYFSLKNLGGGALRTLSHEIDLAFYFFGKPKSHKVNTGHLSNLDINVDDYALILLSYEYQLIRIELDFLNKKTERKGIIFGSEGELHYNFITQEVSVYFTNEKEMIHKSFTNNEMYKEQMLAFTSTINNNKLHPVSSNIEESIQIQKIIDDEQPF